MRCLGRARDDTCRHHLHPVTLALHVSNIPTARLFASVCFEVLCVHGQHICMFCSRHHLPVWALHPMSKWKIHWTNIMLSSLQSAMYSFLQFAMYREQHCFLAPIDHVAQIACLLQSCLSGSFFFRGTQCDNKGSKTSLAHIFGSGNATHKTKQIAICLSLRIYVLPSPAPA